MTRMRLEYPVTIRTYETGPEGVVSPLVLLRHFQEAAGLHADRLGWGYEALLERGLAWVLTRLYFEIARMPGPGEDVTVSTWPVSRDKYNAKRDFRWLGATGEVLGQGASNWVMMDLDSRRVAAIPGDFDEAFRDLLPGGVDFPGRRVAAMKEAEHEASLLARREDLDANAHVNNTHFIAWALEAVPDSVFADRRLASFDIQFRAEVRHRDHVRSLCGRSDREDPGAALGLAHSLVREEDRVQVARAFSSWSAR